MPEFDVDQPLPRWEPSPGVERDPERIDVLIEQLRRYWKRHPHQRLGQLLCNLAGPKPNPLFYVEDHVVSEKLLDAEASQVWPRVHANPPRWLLEGEAPPADVCAELRAIREGERAPCCRTTSPRSWTSPSAPRTERIVRLETSRGPTPACGAGPL